MMHSSPLLSLMGALTEHHVFNGAVRFILGLGVRQVTALILHTLSLMPEGSPVRAVPSVFSDAARAEAEWGGGHPGHPHPADGNGAAGGDLAPAYARRPA
ncbi:hypothetical protein [Enterobacter sp. RIT418]|uniref:hypothetical protein n=1 Tax=Enterobacter sp. RIT418 TaxID=2202164 RepID=UPI0011BF2E30|nr:hypothetical protein [Enterobacter sp. RIT 418]